MVVDKKNDKRDQRDPTQLYHRIKTIQENNKSMTFLEAADAANQMYQANVNGRKSAGTHIT